MTEATYTAWDGKLYEWPPPQGWYEASDGRWWPEGYGPRPEPEIETDGASVDAGSWEDVGADEAERPVGAETEVSTDDEVSVGSTSYSTSTGFDSSSAIADTGESETGFPSSTGSSYDFGGSGESTAAAGSSWAVPDAGSTADAELSADTGPGSEIGSSWAPTDAGSVWAPADQPSADAASSFVSADDDTADLDSSSASAAATTTGDQKPMTAWVAESADTSVGEIVSEPQFDSASTLKSGDEEWADHPIDTGLEELVEGRTRDENGEPGRFQFGVSEGAVAGAAAAGDAGGLTDLAGKTQETGGELFLRLQAEAEARRGAIDEQIEAGPEPATDAVTDEVAGAGSTGIDDAVADEAGAGSTWIDDAVADDEAGGAWTGIDDAVADEAGVAPTGIDDVAWTGIDDAVVDEVEGATPTAIDDAVADAVAGAVAGAMPDAVPDAVTEAVPVAESFESEEAPTTEQPVVDTSSRSEFSGRFGSSRPGFANSAYDEPTFGETSYEQAGYEPTMTDASATADSIDDVLAHADQGYDPQDYTGPGPVGVEAGDTAGYDAPGFAAAYDAPAYDASGYDPEAHTDPGFGGEHPGGDTQVAAEEPPSGPAPAQASGLGYESPQAAVSPMDAPAPSVGLGRRIVYAIVGVLALVAAGVAGYAAFQLQNDSGDGAEGTEQVADAAQPGGEAVMGSLANPHDPGSGIRIEYPDGAETQPWTLQLLSMESDGADGEARLAMQIVNDHAERQGQLADLQLALVGADGNDLASAPSSCQAGDSLDLTSTVEAGESVSGPVCWSVAAALPDGSLLAVESTKAQGRVYIALP